MFHFSLQNNKITHNVTNLRIKLKNSSSNISQLLSILQRERVKTLSGSRERGRRGGERAREGDGGIVGEGDREFSFFEFVNLCFGLFDFV